MHLYKFSDSQKLAFLALAKELIATDNHIDISEASYVSLMKKEMGLDPDVALPEKSRKELLEDFDDRQVRVWLLLELIGLGYIDDQLASEEQDMIEDIASIFGFNESEISRVKDLVIKTKELIRDTNLLINQP